MNKFTDIKSKCYFSVSREIFSLILVSDWLNFFESFHGENYTDAAICCIFCGITGKIHDLEMAL